MMKFTYSTQEPQPYNFRKLGGKLGEDMTVVLSDDAYRRFLYETLDTTDRLTLYKERP